MQTWVTDLRHMPPRGATVPKVARERAEFTREVVEAATAEPTNSKSVSAVTCISRAGQRRCGARVRVALGADGIGWSCEGCGENGLVTGFAGSASDLSGHVASGKKVLGDSTTRNEVFFWRLGKAKSLRRPCCSCYRRARRRFSRPDRSRPNPTHCIHPRFRSRYSSSTRSGPCPCAEPRRPL